MRFKGWCNMTNKDLADVIFPNITKTIEACESEKTPCRRDIGELHKVAREAKGRISMTLCRGCLRQ